MQSAVLNKLMLLRLTPKSLLTEHTKISAYRDNGLADVDISFKRKELRVFVEILTWRQSLEFCAFYVKKTALMFGKRSNLQDYGNANSQTTGM